MMHWKAPDCDPTLGDVGARRHAPDEPEAAVLITQLAAKERSRHRSATLAIDSVGEPSIGNILVNQSLQAADSVDQREIEKFNQLASTWWDADGPMWPLHRLNGLRSRYIVDHIVRHYGRDSQRELPLQGLRLLDIGCGGGLLSESMAQLGASVHGVDISNGNIATARQHAQAMSNPPVYELGTAEELLERQQRYDVVLNMEVVEHVADLPAFMQTCNALVRAGGLQFVSTINRNPVAWFSAIFGAEYVLRWLPRGTHQYRRLVKPAELRDLLERDQMRTITSTGVFVNPLTRRMSLSKRQWINYMLVTEKPIEH